jgi:hypothetical protein
VDHPLGWYLPEKKIEHLEWLQRLKNDLLDSNENITEVEFDPHSEREGKRRKITHQSKH